MSYKSSKRKSFATPTSVLESSKIRSFTTPTPVLGMKQKKDSQESIPHRPDAKDDTSGLEPVTSESSKRSSSATPTLVTETNQKKDFEDSNSYPFEIEQKNDFQDLNPRPFVFSIPIEGNKLCVSNGHHVVQQHYEERDTDEESVPLSSYLSQVYKDIGAPPSGKGEEYGNDSLQTSVFSNLSSSSNKRYFPRDIRETLSLDMPSYTRASTQCSKIESNCFNGLELVEATSHNSSHWNAPSYPFSVWFDGSNRRYFPRDIREVLSLDHDIPSKYFATRARGANSMKPPVMAEHHHGGMEPPRSSYLMEVHLDPGEHSCLLVLIPSMPSSASMIQDLSHTLCWVEKWGVI